jgi:hypothetical protein
VYVNIIQHAEVIKWNNLTVEWGGYNTVTTLALGKRATSTQPRPVGAAEDYFRFTNVTRVKRTWKNTKQQNSNRNNNTNNDNHKPLKTKPA